MGPMEDTPGRNLDISLPPQPMPLWKKLGVAGVFACSVAYVAYETMHAANEGIETGKLMKKWDLSRDEGIALRQLEKTKAALKEKADAMRADPHADPNQLRIIELQFAEAQASHSRAIAFFEQRRQNGNAPAKW